MIISKPNNGFSDALQKTQETKKQDIKTQERIETGKVYGTRIYQRPSDING